MNAEIDSLVLKDISGLAGYGPGWSTILSSTGGFSSTGVSVNLGSVLQVSSAAACLDRISSDLAKLGIIMQKRQGSQYVRVEDHHLLNLLRRPNKRQTGYEMRYMMVSSYVANGNGYGAIILGDNGVPQAIIPQPLGKTTSVVERTDGSLQYICTNPMFRGYKTSKADEHTARRTIDEDQMLHLRRASIDGARGTSVFSTSSELFGLAIAAQTLAARTFRNGASFSFALISDMKLNAQQVAQTQNDFIERMGGIDNAGKPPILHGGTRIEKLSMTPAEAQLLEMREHVDAEICRVMGVPGSLLGIASGDNETYKNLESDMRSYVDGTLLNIITPFEELLNLRLLFDPNGKDIPNGGAVRGEYRFQFDTSTLLRADKIQRFQSYTAGIASHVLTPNEARAEEGLPPRAGGDEFVDQSRTVNVNNHGSNPTSITDLGSDNAGEPDGNDT